MHAIPYTRPKDSGCCSGARRFLATRRMVARQAQSRPRSRERSTQARKEGAGAGFIAGGYHPRPDSRIRAGVPEVINCF
jgi:hypothetical protein